MEPPPEWLTRRLHALKRVGILSLVHESHVNLSALAHPDVRGNLHIVKTLDLTGTNITSLKGIPKLPRITSLILDRSQLADLADVFSVRTITSISLKNTPLSATPHYKLSLVLALGANIVKIDGQGVSSVLRSRADAFPNCAANLVNAGWVAQFPRPSAARFAELCAEFGIEQCDAADGPGSEDKTRGPDQENDDFESLAKQLMQQHEELMQKKQALFGVIEEMTPDEGEIDECRLRIGMLFDDHTIDVDINNDDAVLEAIDGLCKQKGRVKVAPPAEGE